MLKSRLWREETDETDLDELIYLFTFHSVAPHLSDSICTCCSYLLFPGLGYN